MTFFICRKSFWLKIWRELCCWKKFFLPVISRVRRAKWARRKFEFLSICIMKKKKGTGGRGTLRVCVVAAYQRLLGDSDLIALRDTVIYVVIGNSSNILSSERNACHICRAGVVVNWTKSISSYIFLFFTFFFLPNNSSKLSAMLYSLD